MHGISTLTSNGERSYNYVDTKEKLALVVHKDAGKKKRVAKGTFCTGPRILYEVPEIGKMQKKEQEKKL